MLQQKNFLTMNYEVLEKLNLSSVQRFGLHTYLSLALLRALNQVRNSVADLLCDNQVFCVPLRKRISSKVLLLSLQSQSKQFKVTLRVVRFSCKILNHAPSLQTKQVCKGACPSYSPIQMQRQLSNMVAKIDTLPNGHDIPIWHMVVNVDS